MTPKGIIKRALRYRSTSQQELAAELGVKQGAISTTLSRDNANGIQLRTLIRYLDQLEYQIIVRPMESQNPRDELVLDGDDYDDEY